MVSRDPGCLRTPRILGSRRSRRSRRSQTTDIRVYGHDYGMVGVMGMHGVNTISCVLKANPSMGPSHMGSICCRETPPGHEIWAPSKSGLESVLLDFARLCFPRARARVYQACAKTQMTHVTLSSIPPEGCRAAESSWRRASGRGGPPISPLVQEGISLEDA